ncbi:MAG TPA: acylphosphatase [Cyclobacteriaceae bacterium]|nr:acylphosphatase [Cyclobacteriaceae bacterium]HRJ81271.1 acylphosphatase [Cyclobacteriaceae bacterium]
MKRVSIYVRGKVQGVFFRASTVSAAQQIGVKGFVRNEPDGSVYIEAEGDVEKINELIAWCKIGPPRARVEAVEVESLATFMNFTDFSVSR